MAGASGVCCPRSVSHQLRVPPTTQEAASKSHMATMTQSVAMENGTKYIRSLPKHLVTWDSLLRNQGCHAP